MPGQLAYTLNNTAGLPGMLYDKSTSTFIDSKPCGAVVLPFGVVVELVAGVLRIAQGTGNPSANGFWGVVMWQDSMEPGGYQPGQDVPVLRKGRIWVATAAGAAFAQGVAANYTHSSTAATPQGRFTNAAVGAGVGTEISPINAQWFFDGGLMAATNPTGVVDLTIP